MKIINAEKVKRLVKSVPKNREALLGVTGYNVALGDILKEAVEITKENILGKLYDYPPFKEKTKREKAQAIMGLLGG